MENFQITKQHLIYCYLVLEKYLNNQPLPLYPPNLTSIQSPFFVTWYNEPQHTQLGCIGTFQNEDLSKNLQEFIILSSQEDKRFPPVDKQLIKNTSVCLSLLYDFKQCNDIYDWIHEENGNGIILQFDQNGKNYSATFLPQFAIDFDTKNEVFEELIKKSGFKGNKEEIWQKISIVKYRVKKQGMNYEEYKKNENQLNQILTNNVNFENSFNSYFFINISLKTQKTVKIQLVTQIKSILIKNGCW